MHRFANRNALRFMFAGNAGTFIEGARKGGLMAIGKAFRPDSQAPGQAVSPAAPYGQVSNLKRLDLMTRSGSTGQTPGWPCWSPRMTHAEKISEQKGLLISMDEDMKTVQEGSRVQRGILNALRENQIEQGERLVQIEKRVTAVEIRLTGVETRLTGVAGYRDGRSVSGGPACHASLG
jgi:hypothetical protein